MKTILIFLVANFNLKIIHQQYMYADEKQAPQFIYITFTDMSQFGLSGANSHWSYSSAGPYSPYLTGSGLSSCTTPTAAQFNNPALGFTCSSTEQGTTGQEFGGGGNGGGSSRDCVPSKYSFCATSKQ